MPEILRDPEFVFDDQTGFAVGYVNPLTGNPVFGPIAIGPVLWANRPSAAAVPPRSTMQVLDVGIAGSEWIAINGVWSPVNGAVTLYQRTGSVAAPLASLTLSGTTGSFTLPETIRIPAGMLVPGRSQLYLQARWKRGATAVGTAVHNVRLGTTGLAVSDLQILSISGVAAAANQDVFQAGNAWFGNSTTVTRSGFQGWNAQAANAVSDASININTNADMFVTMDFSSSTSGDVFNLLSYTVQLWG